MAGRIGAGFVREVTDSQGIRVQLAESGCPIVGDLAHGGPRSAAGRLCLHAMRLAFEHPVTRRPVAFESAPPGDWV